MSEYYLICAKCETGAYLGAADKRRGKLRLVELKKLSRFLMDHDNTDMDDHMLECLADVPVKT